MNTVGVEQLDNLEYTNFVKSESNHPKGCLSMCTVYTHFRENEGRERECWRGKECAGYN